jgi:hypothetical protein
VDRGVGAQRAAGGAVGQAGLLLDERYAVQVGGHLHASLPAGGDQLLDRRAYLGAQAVPASIHDQGAWQTDSRLSWEFAPAANRRSVLAGQRDAATAAASRAAARPDRGSRSPR